MGRYALRYIGMDRHGRSQVTNRRNGRNCVGVLGPTAPGRSTDRRCAMTAPDDRRLVDGWSIR